MQVVTLRASHIVATLAVLALGAVLIFRPWSAQALGNGAPAYQPYTDAYGRPLPPLPVNAMTPTPVGYAGQPTYATYPPQPVYAYAPARVAQPTYPSQRRVATGGSVEKQRSWKKTALIIGGSAGTGAGVGALIGGKKGALIRAAVGGGGAALYEAVKR